MFVGVSDEAEFVVAKEAYRRTKRSGWTVEEL